MRTPFKGTSNPTKKTSGLERFPSQGRDYGEKGEGDRVVLTHLSVYGWSVHSVTELSLRGTWSRTRSMTIVFLSLSVFMTPFSPVDIYDCFSFHLSRILHSGRVDPRGPRDLHQAVTVYRRISVRHGHGWCRGRGSCRRVGRRDVVRRRSSLKEYWT